MIHSHADQHLTSSILKTTCDNKESEFVAGEFFPRLCEVCYRDCPDCEKQMPPYYDRD